jgi:hypothetical protein
MVAQLTFIKGQKEGNLARWRRVFFFVIYEEDANQQFLSSSVGKKFAFI